jgi:hypothetical protein
MSRIAPIYPDPAMKTAVPTGTSLIAGRHAEHIRTSAVVSEYGQTGDAADWGRCHWPSPTERFSAVNDIEACRS